MPKVSLIVTVLNEAQTIELLLEAIATQTKLPDEFIIVDGGSSDSTIKIINKFVKIKTKQSSKAAKLFKENFTLKKLPNSNRAQARNWAISKAKHQLIAITDASCIPQPSWLEKLFNTYKNTRSPIIGGYFFGLATTPFEQAVVAYTLQAPHTLNPETFIPTTRSVLLTKKIHQELGGFDEQLTTNEDFPFFFFAKEKGVEIELCKEALVGWIPRSNLSQFIKMIFGFAKGDIEAGIVRPRVQLLFGRYLLVLTAVVGLILFTDVTWLQLLPALLFWLAIYLIWAIYKNARYAPQGWYWLPLFQLIADLTVMVGSIEGLVSRYKYQPQVE